MRQRTLPKLLLTIESNGDPVAYELISNLESKRAVLDTGSPLIALLREAWRNVDPTLVGVEIRGKAGRDRAWIEFVKDGRRMRLVLDVDWPEYARGDNKGAQEND